MNNGDLRHSLWRRRLAAFPLLSQPFMHLVAARKANASVIHTLNIDDFLHLRRGDDPEVRLP
jgi:hypothetical protein